MRINVYSKTVVMTQNDAFYHANYRKMNHDEIQNS